MDNTREQKDVRLDACMPTTVVRRDEKVNVGMVVLAIGVVAEASSVLDDRPYS